MEKRFIDIETKILQQEVLLEELHQVMYQQQKKIDQLEAILSSLVKRIREGNVTGEEIGPAGEKPPHY
ncbi:SlyX family protein [Bdellovibrio svalbardensis]|uniref:SlyX family protein n=1 Tax=Bdellovibrio svalbardensis TaxID=2972972 RepID=A0ABT6DHG5_9BACT|nr:SlyX family protein [Bdellovibrio svalbardensis]MDG0816295.1 SlyX family protein [Bdellovibrio svalbardensis]